jgi:hypothetical protein
MTSSYFSPTSLSEAIRKSSKRLGTAGVIRLKKEICIKLLKAIAIHTKKKGCVSQLIQSWQTWMWMATSLFIPEYVYRKEDEREQKINTTACAISRTDISPTDWRIQLSFFMTGDSKIVGSCAALAHVPYESVEFTDQIGIEI